MGAFGYSIVDTGFVRPQCTACYLIEQDGSYVLFDTGVGTTAQTVLDALGGAEHQVDHIILSHVHLDHAGGAGALMQACSNATLWAHPRGLRHMVDPSLLEASARKVYGDQEFERLYGKIEPVPADRARAVDFEQSLRWQGRELNFLDAPGHARHHLALWEAAAETLLAGDAFGLGYPAAPGSCLPTTSPVQFDPEAMVATFKRIVALGPKRVGIAHFGWVEDPTNRATKLERLVQSHVAIARDAKGDPDQTAKRLAELLPDECRALYSFDFEINAQGLAQWHNSAR